MKTANLSMLTLAAALTAHADFSYTTTRKAAQGPLAAAMGPQTTRQFLKGQKMKTDNGDIATIIDFDAQTIMIVDNRQKAYSVMNFSDAGKMMEQSGASAKVDVKETGQRKTINGYNASETIMTIEVESPVPGAGMKMQIEVDMWQSADVPGAQEMRAFYQKNGSRFPWAAMGGRGANQGMQKGMAELQQRMSGMNGVPVLQVMKMKGAAGAPQMPPGAQAGMAQAMAQLEQMKKQGGAQAAAADQAMARMGGGAAGGGSIFEVTTESSEFSTAAIPDSVFAIPAGYQKR